MPRSQPRTNSRLSVDDWIQAGYATSSAAPIISPEFVARLAGRARHAEELRRLPGATVQDLVGSGLTDLLVPSRDGGLQADLPAVLDPVRQLAHGCMSSAWTIGFYVLHNWMLALFDPQAQEEAFAARPFLAPAPLAPTGRGLPVDGGVRLSGRWSWATGVMDGNWIVVGATVRTGRCHLPGAGAAARHRHRDPRCLAHRRHACQNERCCIRCIILRKV
jgi:alkylation response protein AidB-like acyl-CoA dehydrogenase